MAGYPVTHTTQGGPVIERGPDQFFIRLYVGKAADGTRKYYSKTWRTLERATQDLLEQKLKRSAGSCMSNPPSSSATTSKNIPYL
jgi:hypothetical protein